jgi:hypothetical protein
MSRRKLAFIVRHPLAAYRFHRACVAPWSVS